MKFEIWNSLLSLFKFYRKPITHKKKKKLNNFVRLSINKILIKVVRGNP